MCYGVSPELVHCKPPLTEKGAVMKAIRDHSPPRKRSVARDFLNKFTCGPETDVLNDERRKLGDVLTSGWKPSQEKATVAPAELEALVP